MRKQINLCVLIIYDACNHMNDLIIHKEIIQRDHKRERMMASKSPSAIYR